MAVPRFRRVVTAVNAAGRSVVARDGLSPGDVIRTVHWFTDPPPRPLRTVEEVDAGWAPHNPPAAPGATTFSFYTVPPDDPPRDLETYYADTFGRPGVVRGDTQQHPGMHRTDTVDYIVVLEGEITLLLPGEHRVLRPFDAVVQVGAEHAWVNRTDKPALMAAVTVGAGQRSPADAEAPGMALGAMFELTPAETELSLALAGGESLRDFAGRRGVAYTTVRSHLVNLRMKLDAKSQAEVVRIVTAALVRIAARPAAD